MLAPTLDEQAQLLKKFVGRALMATTCRQLAFTLPLMVASLALATAAGAQFARVPAFDQVRAIERAQFRDFWDDRGWSNRNNAPGSF